MCNTNYMARPPLYQYNSHYFSSIDTADKAYFLGLLFADGYLNLKCNKLTLNLQIRDRELIESLGERLVLSDNKPFYIRKCSVKDKTKSDQFSIVVSSPQISKDLQKLGFTLNKTFTAKFPIIPKQFFKDFIRGYFDGDGHFTVRKDRNGRDCSWGITGTEDMLLSIQDILVLELGLNKIKLKATKSSHKGIHKLIYGGLGSCKKIFNYLYTDTNLYLCRKFLKIQNHIKQFKTRKELVLERDQLILTYKKQGFNNKKIAEILKIENYIIFSCIARNKHRI